MARTRTRSSPHTGYVNGTAYFNPIRTISEVKRFSNWTDATHYKHVPVSGLIWSGSSSQYWNFVTDNSTIDDLLTVARLATNQPKAIPWNKLPTSSDFNSIAFLAELRESLAMFSTRAISQMLKNPSGIHGFLEFGFTPFLADLVNIFNLVEYVRTMSNNALPFSTSYTQIFDITKYWYSPQRLYYWVYGTSTVRFSGTIRPDLTSLPTLADFVGFKPDLVTLYELTPLSFVLDYFLPIGDYLDNLLRGGWTSSIQFEGSISEKSVISGNNSSRPDVVTMNSCVFYKREFVSTSISVHKRPKPVSIDIPSFKQLFNAVYIAASLLKGKR